MHVAQLLVRLLRVQVVELSELLAHLLLRLLGDRCVELLLQSMVDVEVRLPFLRLAERIAVQEVLGVSEDVWVLFWMSNLFRRLLLIPARFDAFLDRFLRQLAGYEPAHLFRHF